MTSAPRGKRLLIVVNEARFFLSHRLPLAKAAAEAGFDVRVATPEDELAPKIREAGLRHEAYPLSRRGTSPPRELLSLASLVQLYRRVAPDIVHHVSAKPILYGGIAARLARVPAVVHAVSGLGYVFIDPSAKARVLRQGIRAAYALATSHPNCAVIFQNDDDRAAFGSAIRTENITMIRGSGVDLARFRPTPLPAAEKPPLVVLPARMLWHKGVGEFVEAARILRKKSVRFVLVGDVDPHNPAGVSREQLDIWVREGIVEWWGHRTDMPEVLAQATIVCLPSYREGTPKALLEACACARPILTTDVPGCRDVIDGRDYGLLVPPRDGPAIARAVEELLANRPRLERMSQCAADTAGAFAVEKVIERTLSLYGELLRQLD